MNSNMRGMFIFLIIAALLGVLWFFATSKKHPELPSNILNELPVSLSSPSPSPVLFEELTIPYLRSLNFDSKLSDLKPYLQTATYDSYLTSYTSDGLKINGLLTQPKGDQPDGGWPAIVFVHGYIPPTIYKTTEKYIDYVNYLASRGYVVFKIDLRGNGDSEGEPEGAYYSSDYIIDVLNAYSSLQNSGFVNRDKIGLWGHSMAGNVVLRAVAAKRNIPAVSIWAGAVYTYLDMAEFGIQDGSYRPPVDREKRENRRQLLRDTYGEAKDGNPFWGKVAATNYLEGVTTAIQINHAIDDDVVNIGYSRELEEILNKTPIIHELNEYPSGGHNITNPSFTPAMQNTVRFFDKYLKSSNSSE